MSARRSTASSGSAYFARSRSVRRCIHRSPPLRRTTSPARPKWSMWACVTTRRASRSIVLPAVARAASRTAVPSPRSPSSPNVAMPQSTRVSPSSSERRYALTLGTPWMPSGRASRCTPAATSETSTAVPGVGARATPSVLDLGDRPQFPGGRRPESEELEVGRDHLEEHVLAHLYRAALGHGRTEQRRELLLHDHLPDERARRDAVDVHRQRVVVLHAERGRVDHDVVPVGVLGPGAHLELGVVLGQPAGK